MENESVGKVEAVPDEQAAYEELYRSHYARVMGLCRLLLAAGAQIMVKNMDGMLHALNRYFLHFAVASADGLF